MTDQHPPDASELSAASEPDPCEAEQEPIPVPGPYACRLLIGRCLREFRTLAGIDAGDAARHLGVVRATLSRIESGYIRSRYRAGDIERLCAFYRAEPDVVPALLDLLNGTRAPDNRRIANELNLPDLGTGASES